MSLQVAQIVECTEAEGPGKRFALWVQGCSIRCPGCCNPEMFSRTGGTSFEPSELGAMILAARSRYRLEGISLLGGEPFEQAAGLADLVEKLRSENLSVMTFSGYRLEELQGSADSAIQRLLSATDVLVDGRFDASRPDTARRWIGSTNQRVHFLNDRYSAEDPCWRTGNTVEIRWQDGELSVNGFPSEASRTLWANLRRRGAVD